MSDEIKIREDAIQIQQDDIRDTLKSIESETAKISAALAFIGLLVVQSLNFVTQKPIAFKIIFVCIVGLAIVSATLSLFARKIFIHTNVNELFVNKSSNDSWEDYLDHKHLRFIEIYNSTQDLLRKKLTLTKLTLILIVGAAVVLLVGIFI